MTWVSFAIFSAALSGIVSIFDSHLLSRRLPNLNTYLLPLGIFHGTVALLVIVFQPISTTVPLLYYLAALGSGALSGLGSILMLNTIRKGEISRIVPVINTSPIFVALMAVPLLGETLNYRNWLGILATVAGAILISLQKSSGSQKTTLQKSFFTLAVCSVMFAVSSIFMKYALEALPFWNIYSITSLILAICFIAFSARPATFHEIKRLPQRNQIAALIVIGQSIIVVAMVLGTLSVQKGPVALASTVMGARPAFVFLYTIVVSRLFPKVLNEPLTRNIALLKFTAIALIVSGVALLTL